MTAPATPLPVGRPPRPLEYDLGGLVASRAGEELSPVYVTHLKYSDNSAATLFPVDQNKLARNIEFFEQTQLQRIEQQQKDWEFNFLQEQPRRQPSDMHGHIHWQKLLSPNSERSTAADVVDCEHPKVTFPDRFEGKGKSFTSASTGVDDRASEVTKSSTLQTEERCSTFSAIEMTTDREMPVRVLEEPNVDFHIVSPARIAVPSDLPHPNLIAACQPALGFPAHLPHE